MLQSTYYEKQIIDRNQGDNPTVIDPWRFL